MKDSQLSKTSAAALHALLSNACKYNYFSGMAFSTLINNGHELTNLLSGRDMVTGKVDFRATTTTVLEDFSHVFADMIIEFLEQHNTEMLQQMVRQKALMSMLVLVTAFWLWRIKGKTKKHLLWQQNSWYRLMNWRLHLW